MEDLLKPFVRVMKTALPTSARALLFGVLVAYLGFRLVKEAAILRRETDSLPAAIAEWVGAGFCVAGGVYGLCGLLSLGSDWLDKRLRTVSHDKHVKK